VLKRSSIRNKLIVVLALLSTTVVLLASSGFWGLYRYKQLANAVSQRAIEIPMANDLHRLAMTMRGSHRRIMELQKEEGMIHQSPLGDPLIGVAEFEQSEFKGALVGFNARLAIYEGRLGGKLDDRSIESRSKPTLLVDDVRQRRGVGELRESFATIESFYHETMPMNETRNIRLQKLLDTLFNQTDEHLALIHSGMADFSSEVRGQYRVWIGVAWSSTVLAVIMVCALLWVFRSVVVKPFNTLLEGTRLVVDENFAHRIDLGTGDELSELAQAMNGMTDRFQRTMAELNAANRDLDQKVQQRTREVIQNEQLASVGFLAAGVAHEINNPLATIAWSAESLISRVSEATMAPAADRAYDDELCDSLRTNLQRIEDEAYRCKGITEKLLDFSRLSEVRRATTDLVDLVNDVVTMVTKVGKYKCKTINVHGCESMIADVNPQEIRQVVLNLVTNALESVDTDGAVDVTIGETESMAGIVVKDNGCGMNPEVLQHLFEPFFTRRRDGTGTGLGLSITYRIVSQHGGSLVAKSDGENRGSEMQIKLPFSQESEGNQPKQYQGLNNDRAQAA